MAKEEVTTRSGRTIKTPVQKYEQNCVMNASKTAKYKKKVARRIPAKERMIKHRGTKKSSTKQKTKKKDNKKKK